MVKSIVAKLSPKGDCCPVFDSRSMQELPSPSGLDFYLAMTILIQKDVRLHNYNVEKLIFTEPYFWF